MGDDMKKKTDRHEVYRKKNPEKYHAGNVARWKYKKRQICSISNCNILGERHHPDYSIPNEIIWLCRKHHKLAHGIVRNKCILCGEVVNARKLCKKHYNRKYRKAGGW